MLSGLTRSEPACNSPQRGVSAAQRSRTLTRAKHQACDPHRAARRGELVAHIGVEIRVDALGREECSELSTDGRDPALPEDHDQLMTGRMDAWVGVKLSNGVMYRCDFKASGAVISHRARGRVTKRAGNGRGDFLAVGRLLSLRECGRARPAIGTDRTSIGLDSVGAGQIACSRGFAVRASGSSLESLRCGIWIHEGMRFGSANEITEIIKSTRTRLEASSAPRGQRTVSPRVRDGEHDGELGQGSAFSAPWQYWRARDRRWRFRRCPPEGR